MFLSPGHMIARLKYLALMLGVFLLITLSFPASAFAATPRSDASASTRQDSTFSSENLGGSWYNQSSPNAAVSWGANRIDEFIVGTDDQLYHYWLTPTPHLESWGGVWADPGDRLNATGPAAVSWGSPRLDVFLAGQNGLLYHYWQDGGSVYALEALPQANTLFPSYTYVSATTWGTGRLDVFAIGNNRNLYHYWQSGGSTWNWSDLGGNYTPGELAEAVTWGVGRLDVFVPDGNVIAHYAQQSSWFNSNPAFSMQTIEPLPSNGQWADGNSEAYLSAVSWGSGRLDLFAYGYSSSSGSYQLYHLWSQGGTAFSIESLPLSLPSYITPNIKAVTWGQWRLDVFSIGDPSYLGTPLYHIWQQNDSVFQIEEIDNGVVPYNAVAATTWGAGRLDVFATEGSSFSIPEPLYHFWQD